MTSSSHLQGKKVASSCLSKLSGLEKVKTAFSKFNFPAAVAKVQNIFAAACKQQDGKPINPQLSWGKKGKDLRFKTPFFFRVLNKKFFLFSGWARIKGRGGGYRTIRAKPRSGKGRRRRIRHQRASSLFPPEEKYRVETQTYHRYNIHLVNDNGN